MVVNTLLQKDVDQRYLVEGIRTQQELQTLLNEWSDEADRVVLQYTTSSGVNNPAKLIEEMNLLTAAYIAAYALIMNKGMSKIAQAKAASAIEESVPLLRIVGDDIGIARFKANMARFDQTVGKKWRSVASGKAKLTFDERLLGIEISSKKTVSNIVNLGVKKELTGKEIQTLIRDYLNPKNTPGKPWDIARSLLDATKKYVPKDVLGGSTQSNLYSLTRTIQAETWRSMTEYAYQDAEWVKDYSWVLSGSHPREDICDEYAADSPYKKGSQRPFSHQHCMCDYVANLRSIVELRAILETKGTLYNVK